MDKWERIILHADMDAFFAAVEQRDRPELKGKAVIVGGLGGRGVVSTASYEARPFGVHSAMPMSRARRLCPGAIYLSPDFERYHETSDKIMSVFGSFSPLVEPLSLDEAFLDMTGCEGLFGPPLEMGLKIKAAVAKASGGLTVSVGISGTKFVAKVASDHEKPDGLTVVRPESTLEFLWPLPASKLWGVGPKTRDELEKMGLKTIGDVARAQRVLLEKRLGEFGLHIHRLANGIDEREVISEHDAKSVGAEYTLEKDIVGREAIAGHLRDSAERVARRLRSENLVASGVRVKLRTSSFRLLTRQCKLSRPTDTERELVKAATGLLELFDLEAPMRLVGLAAFDLCGRGGGAQLSLFGEGDAERDRRLDRAVDAIREKFGKDILKRGSTMKKNDDG